MNAVTRGGADALSPDLAAALGIDVAPMRLPPPELWPAEGRCFAGGQDVCLSQREFDLLATLVAAPRRIIRRERPYELVWAQKMRPRERAVDVNVRKVRVKLWKAALGWSFIHTHPYVGYRVAPERMDGS